MERLFSQLKNKEKTSYKIQNKYVVKKPLILYN